MGHFTMKNNTPLFQIMKNFSPFEHFTLKKLCQPRFIFLFFWFVTCKKDGMS